MAIERKIPKDISKYESKLIAGLTTRQIVFGVPALAIGVGCFFLFQEYLPSDVNIFIDFALALPLFCCGWIKPYGIPFEKYVSMVFVSMFLAPKHRKYCTENSDSTDGTATINSGKAQKKRTNKKARNKNRSNQLKKYL